jgi:hypothetical protein
MNMAVDWSGFDKYPESTIECRCGAAYRSHAKAVMTPTSRIVTRKPCPQCGQQDGNATAARSDPELMRLAAESDE